MTSTDPKFSFVLLSYGRPKNLPVILNNVLDQPFVDDAVVIHQGPIAIGWDQLGIPPEALKRVTMRNQNENRFTYSRFMATRSCRHDLILTCDDDNLVRNWPAIRDTFLANGECITACMPEGHLRLDPSLRWGDCHEVLLGWGSAFDRRWIAGAFAGYVNKFGYDYLLFRKADRLFSMLLNRHHQVLLADYRQLPGATDAETALYRRDDHQDLTRDARKRAWGLLGTAGTP